jgi:hypothetical protein
VRSKLWLLVFVLVGCSFSTLQVDYVPPEGTTYKQYALDQYNCERDAMLAYPSRVTGIDGIGEGIRLYQPRSTFEERCMKAHGYRGDGKLVEKEVWLQKYFPNALR